MNAIEIRNVSKTYDGFAIRDLDLVLPKGCIMGLIGKNGAGKTTLIKMLLGITKKETGSISVMGTDSSSLDMEDIGVVMDEAGFPECLTPSQLDNIMKNIYKKWDSRVYADYIKRFDLPKNKAFGEFSKGMKMKLSIAVAMSHAPRLLVLDEATSGLDPVVRDEILDIFAEFTRDEEHSILMSSHIVSDLEKICDYIAFIKEGQLMLCEEKDVILQKYAMVRGTHDQITSIDPEAVKGIRKTPYGTEAIVDREAIPDGAEAGKADIEDLFIFMSKEIM